MRLPRFRFTTATGAAVTAALFVLVTLVRLGLDSGMGFGTVGDPLVVIALFVATTAVMAGPAWLVLLVVRRLPTAITLLVTGSVTAGVLLLRPRDGALLDGVLLALGIVLAAWIGTVVAGFVQVVGARHGGGPIAPLRRRSTINAAAALSTCLLISGWLLLTPSGPSFGTDEPRRVDTTRSGVPDPAAPGPYEVESFTYGSGSDRRRPAYADEVVLTTLSQDLRPLLPGFRGLEAQRHRAHWGFGLEAVPLNATVWMPEGDGPFPVVLFIPGIDTDSERSELGYAYLGELLASRGYVVVVTDMNFLGRPHIARTAGEMPVRAWLALKHLELLKEWRERRPGGRADRIDLDRIVLAGHSRGGEAAVLAAMLNSLERYPPNAAIPVSFGFPIQGVFALAPTDQFHPVAGKGSALSDISYLVLHGSHDGDVASFMGTAQYQRISVSAGSPAFKASVYVVGANHSHFNTRTSGRDLGGIAGLLLDPSQLLGGEGQRRVTSVFVSAFVDAVLRKDARYHALFEDPRTGSGWLPDTRFATRFEDGRTRSVARFEEDLDPVTATFPGASIEGRNLTIWREEPLTLRNAGDRVQGTHVARVGWSRGAGDGAEPSWDVRLPVPLPDDLVHPSGYLRFSMGYPVRAGGPPATSVEIETSDGIRARLDPGAFAPDPPADLPRLWRVRLLEALSTGGTDDLLQDYLIPLAAFRHVEPDFDPTRVRTVRFVFDRDPAGTVLLDDIGFREPAPPSSVDLPPPD